MLAEIKTRTLSVTPVKCPMKHMDMTTARESSQRAVAALERSTRACGKGHPNP